MKKKQKKTKEENSVKYATYIVIGDQGIHVVLLEYGKLRVNIWSDKNAVYYYCSYFWLSMWTNPKPSTLVGKMLVEERWAITFINNQILRKRLVWINSFQAKDHRLRIEYNEIYEVFLTLLLAPIQYSLQCFEKEFWHFFKHKLKDY